MTPGYPNYEYDRQPNQPAAHHQPQQGRAQITPEEIRLLRECNRESFYYRSFPFALTGMASVYLAVKKGYLNPHPKWGSTFKQIGAAFVGWFVGKLSYRTICEEKFLHLQNSSIADVIRKKRGLQPQMFEPDRRSENDDNLSFNSQTTQSQDQDFHLSSGSLNLDTDKNVQYSGLDDRNRPTTDNAVTETDENLGHEKQPVTYDELRFKNRHQNERSRDDNQSLSSKLPPVRSFESYSFPERQESDAKDQPRNPFGNRWDR